MKKWSIVLITLFLLASVVSVAYANPGNGTNAYTMPAKCGGGEIIVQILNENSVASFKLGDVHGNVGILKAVFIWWGDNWYPLKLVPGVGVAELTEICVWEEGGMKFMSWVLIPHD